MSIVIAAGATHVGNVRDHNEDSHVVDVDEQVFIVADGMGGHAAGEVASAAAVKLAHTAWTALSTRRHVRDYTEQGDADTRRKLVGAIKHGVMRAHLDIHDQSQRDDDKRGMGCTFTGFVVAGGDAVFAHVGDSRAYLVRDGIALRLSEDHTLLARLKAAGIDPEAEGGDVERFRGVLTNALGVGGDVRVATFIVPLYSGDRILLCSDGVHDYLEEAEIGEIMLSQPSPARASQRFIDVALERGGADNATAVVVKVMEAGETKTPREQRERDEAAIAACPLFAGLSATERLRALRITIGREYKPGKPLSPVALGERVAYVLLEGSVQLPHNRGTAEAGALIYPAALVDGTPQPERDDTATATSHTRLLTIRRDDFFEITEEESELGVKMYANLAKLMAR